MRSIGQSKFLRSIYLQVFSIFTIMLIGVAVIVTVSFSSEIDKSLTTEKKDQLSSIAATIYSRMDEVDQIAYSISVDESFLLEPINEEGYTGFDMSQMLKRYLVGNDFIEYLSYYRLSEPDMIYSSVGSLTFNTFWHSYINSNVISKEEYLDQIKNSTSNRTISSDTHFSCIYPLPQFSSNPKAFVVMMIPLREVQTLLSATLANSYGKVSIFNAEGDEITSSSTLDEDIDLKQFITGNRKTVKIDKSRFVLNRVNSVNGGFTYVSIIRLNDLVSGLFRNQALFYLLLFTLIISSSLVMIRGIIKKYKPIQDLAIKVSNDLGSQNEKDIIDENDLIANRMEQLKEDSGQKQKFETAYRQAEAASLAKSSFLSNMSHDIRTPMNAIIGMTELALKHKDDADYVTDCLNKVEVSSKYLLDIINNVLDISRIESGTVTLLHQDFKLSDFIYEIETIINQSVQDKKHNLTITASNVLNEDLVGDPVKLTQIFINILSNSIKYTPEGGNIGVKLVQNPSPVEGKANFSFVFTDTGIGMSKDFIKKVFDQFSRADSSEVSKIEGTGLGMAIVKSYVSLMGGTITCESEIDLGTTFTVNLTLDINEDSTDSVIHDIAKKNHGLTVLLVGIDENSLSNQSSLFSHFGFIVRKSFSIKDALQVLRSTSLSVVIINHSNGFNAKETASSLFKTAAEKGVKMVVASSDYSILEQSQVLGVKTFVRKPIFKSTIIQIFADEDLSQNNLNRTEIDLSGKRILVAEDNEINRYIALKILSETKAEITLTKNGKEALNEFINHPNGYFDVILMDIRMPIMDGYQATAAIRQIDKKIPIFALTANTFEEDVQEVRKAGMTGHIAKPYKPEDIYKELEKTLR